PDGVRRCLSCRPALRDCRRYGLADYRPAGIAGWIDQDRAARRAEPPVLARRNQSALPRSVRPDTLVSEVRELVAAAPGTKTPIPARIYRAVRIVLHLFAGVFEVALLFPLREKSRRDLAIARWSARLLAILNVRPSLRGSP